MFLSSISNPLFKGYMLYNYSLRSIPLVGCVVQDKFSVYCILMSGYRQRNKQRFDEVKHYKTHEQHAAFNVIVIYEPLIQYCSV